MSERTKFNTATANVKVLIDSELHLTGTEDQVNQAIRDRLTFTNPQWEENEKRGFSNWQTPKDIRGYSQAGHVLTMPRGFTRQLVGILKYYHVAYQLEDRRRTLVPVDFTFTGEFRDFQKEAVDALAARDFGTLAAPTGSGKTVMALALIAERRQPALVVVHTKELLEQWIERIETFLGIPEKEIGIIGGGKLKVGEKISVALVQSLYKCADEIAPHIGHLVLMNVTGPRAGRLPSASRLLTHGL